MPHAVWKSRPEADNFPKAESYLALLFSPREAAALVGKLRKARVVTHPAKDIFRASTLRLLPGDDPHVARDLGKIAKGKKLAPILLLRGDAARGLPLVIADGYHRLCAAYHHDYDEPVPCCIVNRPKG